MCTCNCMFDDGAAVTVVLPCAHTHMCAQTPEGETNAPARTRTRTRTCTRTRTRARARARACTHTHTHTHTRARATHTHTHTHTHNTPMSHLRLCFVRAQRARNLQLLSSGCVAACLLGITAQLLGMLVALHSLVVVLCVVCGGWGGHTQAAAAACAQAWDARHTSAATTACSDADMHARRTHLLRLALLLQHHGLAHPGLLPAWAQRHACLCVSSRLAQLVQLEQRGAAVAVVVAGQRDRGTRGVTGWR
jgi:hypothetical protein